jgi:arylsulfatase A-like enzyme
MNLIVLSVDRLHQGYLGPYGNAWVGTTAFNRLAAEGFTFDHAVSDMPELDAFYRACWAGGQELSSERTLPKLLSAAGLPMTLLTDEPLLDAAWHGGAIERLDLTLPDNPQTADTAEETHLAEVFASSIAWLSEAREPFSLWIHTRGLGAPWDAPLEYRDRYSDEEEAPPPRFVDVPQLVLRDDYDPDELLGYCQAYAGQVRLLDECLAGLMEWLDESPMGRDTLLVVIGVRGIALGEHRRIGAWDNALHGETIHLPWLMRFPDRTGQACRTQSIVQASDLFATLTDVFKLDAQASGNVIPLSTMPLILGEVSTLRDRALVRSKSGERGIRTPAWYLRMMEQLVDGDPADVRRLLYAMPDDRWETNDLARRCPDIVEALENAAGDPLAPLPESLTRTMR